MKIIIIVFLEVGRLHIYLRQIYGRQPLESLQALRTGDVYTIIRCCGFRRIAFYIFVHRAGHVGRDDTRLGDGRGEDLVPLGGRVVVVAFFFPWLSPHALR